METRASFELRRMLGSGEIIEKLEMSWDELVYHGDEPFDLYFPPNDVLFNSIFGWFRTSVRSAIQITRQLSPTSRLPRLDGYIQNDLHDIDTTTSLLRNALALRPQRHSDHPSSLHNLALALTAQLCHELLPLCKGCPPLYEDLQAAARQGPAIILNASKYSCSAIIVPTSGDPPSCSLAVCYFCRSGRSQGPMEQAEGLAAQRQGNQAGMRADWGLGARLLPLGPPVHRFARAIQKVSRMTPMESRTDLIVLSWIIWHEIMLPIVNVLEHVLKLKRRSRIWLCPTAAFTSIPLHAAHPFQTKADRSVKESRQSMKKRVPPSFVVIGQGQPGAGTGKALLAVDSELELVHKLVPATANRTIISGDTAIRAGALEALQQNTWVHLVCHGKQDPTQPYNSHFREIPRAEFAFLSACHTAIGDEKTPDEVIHLAAGLQFSGFKSVIGTLWEVDDAVAKHVVEAFYTYMFRDLEDVGVMDCTRAAWALNCATHVVKTKVSLEQKMGFIHIGV
ncbi:CHAT domain-containing protein [Suillus fuscotomentosus]|uniref:CHAT domain-containing protein n=1 Tax=Suillus fuscotomentosus TaxID=1912939 RepID=A0AAD4E7S3_9AGAM|nr:CHAT domain-containing protein [Suillus fuscotomentosus]KAG1901206.1 CHAT domain-containing protein [Suillus fuscotomentosus]